MNHNLSFFTKRAFYNINPHEDYDKRTKPLSKGRGYLMRVSSMIRGDQICEYLGARMNPSGDYQNDVCIYVKPRVLPGNDFKFEGIPYLDICDSPDLYALCKLHPEVPVIAASDYNYEMLKRILPNRIVNIPEQHCNFDNLTRKRDKVKTIGVIGSPKAFAHIPQELKDGIKKLGFEYVEFARFHSRQDVVDFYMNIDIQLIWRPYFNYRRDILMNPLKIVNASSFGIPTIAYDELCFKEMENCYLPVKTVPEFLEKAEDLKTPTHYLNYMYDCLDKSKKYHISEISKLYKNLCQ